MILVTGANGVLGSRVVQALRAAGADVRGLGRSEAPPGVAIEWCRADLVSGSGLATAVKGVRSVVHCASDPRRPGDDLRSLRTLVDAVRPSGGRILYVGIAGIEGAAEALGYYRVKLECERLLAGSGLPFAITRATQFHPFVDRILGRLTLGPLQLSPPVRLQPVDVSFVASTLATHVLAGAEGRTADVHGPELLDGIELTRQWQRACGSRRLRVPIPPVGKLRAFRRLEAVRGDGGGATWWQWLGENVARQ